MAQKPETVFRRRFVRKLKRLPKTYIESIQQETICGTHDLKLCVNTWYVSLELKSHIDAPVSKLQDYNMKQIWDAGGLAFIVYPENEEEILDILFNLTEGEVLWN